MVAVLGQGVELDQPAWHGLFPGTVVSTDDPDKGGRVRVRVPQVYGDTTEDEYIPDDQLPWARPCYPSSGEQHGAAWAPEEDAAVWVTFWGGDPERPVIVGGWYPPQAAGGTKIPKEFSSSYEMGAPRTRLVKTENGHVFEMRWKKKESFIRFTTEKGIDFRLTDDSTEGGTKIELTTPGGYHIHLDDPQKYILVETPGGRRIRLDDKPGQRKILAQTPNHHVLLDDELLLAEMATPQRRVTLDDPNQLAEVITPARHAIINDASNFIEAASATRRVRLDDAAQFCSMASPTRHVTLDDAAQNCEMASPTRKVRLDDAAQIATLADPTQQVTLDGNVPQINIITPGIVNVTAGVDANIVAAGAVNATAGGAATVTAAGAVTVSGSAISQTSTSPVGTAVTNAAGLSTSAFTGAAVRNFAGALVMLVVGLFTLNLSGAGTVTAVGILSLFGSSVLLGNGITFKRLVNEDFLTAIFNLHTHTLLAFGTTSIPNPQAVVGVHTTNNTKAN